MSAPAHSQTFTGADDLTAALKEVHDYRSAFREVEALQLLQNCPNVLVMHEYFWREDEDAILVLEFLKTSLSAVIRDANKRWVMHMLSGLDSCHRIVIVHRDLKPNNFLVFEDWVLKLADFCQFSLH